MTVKSFFVDTDETRVSSITREKATAFLYREICDATSNFSTSSKIGQGSYGSVYRGKLKGNVCNSNHISIFYFFTVCSIAK